MKIQKTNNKKYSMNKYLLLDFLFKKEEKEQFTKNIDNFSKYIDKILQNGESLTEFELNCKIEAAKITKKLNFKIKKIVNYNEKEKSVSVLLQDKNSNFECWFDLWIDSYDEEITGDWNTYIFNTNNSRDLIQKYIQENENVFENAFYTALEFENYI